MATRTAVVIAFALVAALGCSDSSNPVREYGSTLTGGLKKADRAKASADLLTIKAEIMRYKAERGQYPPSLEALRLQDIRPGLYSYDPETGAVALAR